MADFISGTAPPKCQYSENITSYNDQPQSGIIDDVPLQPNETILLYNEPPQSGLVDNVSRTEFVTYTN